MKIGLLVSRSGPAGLWAPSCDSGAMLAVAELNAIGGILGHAVHIVLADAGQVAGEAAAAARDIVDIEGVDAVVGMHPSNVRAAIRRGLRGRVPYVYTPQYEGGERAPYLVTTGGTDDEVLGPAVGWLADRRHARRFFLVGNDYVWPLQAHEIARGIVRSCGGKVVGQSIIPFGTGDFTPIIDLIQAARPDVVVMALLGLEAARFNRAFAEAGLARSMLRLGLATDETVLYAIGAENTENLYASLNYFAHMRSTANDRFLEVYHDSFGETGTSGESLMPVVLRRRALRRQSRAIDRAQRRRGFGGILCGVLWNEALHDVACTGLRLARNYGFTWQPPTGLSFAPSSAADALPVPFSPLDRGTTIGQYLRLKCMNWQIYSIQ